MDDDSELHPPPLRPPLHNSFAPRDEEPDVELEKLKKWQQERMERRLRGEYESMLLHLGELIQTNIHTPLRVASVRIEGATRTRPSFLDWLVKPHLKDVQTSESDLESVLLTARKITHSLLATDNFSSVLPRLEASRDVLASEGDVELVFQTRQKGRYFLKTATEVGSQEGSVSIQGRSRNTFGGAEVLEASFSSGLKTRLAGHISLSAPLTPDLKNRGELSLFGLEKDYTHFASCFEGIRGLKTLVRNSGRYSSNEFAFEASIRHIRNILPTASLSIREAAGHTVKSSVSHTYVHDTRDDKAVPTRGVYLKTQQELAGLGGDVSYFKSHFHFLTSRKIFSGMTVSVSGRAGALFPLFGRQPIFNDRFQLGGPLDVRMFKENGLGPQDGSDSLGGDLFWAAGVSVISDIPKRPQWPVKSHLFVNAGRLDTMDKDLSLAKNVAACLSKPSVTVGVGLLYKIDPVRVEVNFGVPLAASRSDAQRKGFQLGIGLDFL